MNRSLSTSAVLVGSAVAYWLVLGRAHIAEIAERHEQMTGAYLRFEASERETAQETELLDCAARLDHCRAELMPRLTRDPALPLLLAATAELKGSGLSVEHSEVLPADGALGQPNERLRVAVSGTLGRVFAAVCTLENAATPTRITEFTLQVGEGQKVRSELTIVRNWREER